MIPPDSLVPPLKPADIGGPEDGEGHLIHAEHAMKASTGNLKINSKRIFLGIVYFFFSLTII